VEQRRDLGSPVTRRPFMEESVAGCTAGLVDRAHRGGTRTHLSMGDIRVTAFRNVSKRKRYCAKRAICFEASDDPSACPVASAR